MPELNPEDNRPSEQSQQPAVPLEPAVAPVIPAPPVTTKKKHWITFTILSIVSVLVLAIVAVLIWYMVQLAPKTSVDVYHVVKVESGSGTKQIAQDLESKGVIKNANAFLIYTKISNSSSLQAGSYRLSSKLTTPEIVNILESGKTSTINVLILPGQRLSQIRQKFIDLGYSEAEIQQAFESARSHPLLKGLSEDLPIEGYLFPDTYNIAPDTSAEQLVKLMLDNFQSKITPKLVADLKKQGLSLQEGVILASVVQKEVKDYPNEQKVAQVFLKRLKEGSVLGSDVTYQYVGAETGQNVTPELNSPYNTRKVAGLPPTAIANFNISALQALAYPAKTDYNYFVAGDDGTVYYSKTLEEHEALTRQHCASCFQ